MPSSSLLSSGGSRVAHAATGIGFETALKTEMLHISYTGVITRVRKRGPLPDPGPKRRRDASDATPSMREECATAAAHLPSK